MKRYLKLSLFMIALLTLFFITAVKLNSQQAAQDTVSSVLNLSSLKDLSLATLFTSLSALAATVLLLTSLLKKYLNSNGTITIILSGVVSFVLCALGYSTELGIFEELSWVYILIYGVAAMLIANGLSTWGVIAAVLTFLKLKVPAEK